MKKYIWLITTLIALGGFILSIYQSRISAQSPLLKYYYVKVSPEIDVADLQTARLKIENSMFLSTHNLIEQDSNLTYSQALDKVLPITETVGNLSGGVVVVIQNQGQVSASKIHVSIKVGTSIEKYEIITNESFSAVEYNQTEGTLKFDVNRLTVGDEIRVPILFPGQYAVTVIAARKIKTPMPPPPNGNLAQVKATQTAMDSNKQATEDDLDGFLRFYTRNLMDNIYIDVFVSSDEMQGEQYTPADTSQEENLFLDIFRP
jgi:hypothetical protein